MYYTHTVKGFILYFKSSFNDITEIIKRAQFALHTLELIQFSCRKVNSLLYCYWCCCLCNCVFVRCDIFCDEFHVHDVLNPFLPRLSITYQSTFAPNFSTHQFTQNAIPITRCTYSDLSKSFFYTISPCFQSTGAFQGFIREIRRQKTHKETTIKVTAMCNVIFIRCDFC